MQAKERANLEQNTKMLPLPRAVLPALQLAGGESLESVCVSLSVCAACAAKREAGLLCLRADAEAAHLCCSSSRTLISTLA